MGLASAGPFYIHKKPLTKRGLLAGISFLIDNTKNSDGKSCRLGNSLLKIIGPL